MKGSEKFIALLRGVPEIAGHGSRNPPRRRAAKAGADAVHGEIDDGRRVERQQLAQQEPADDGHAERKGQLRAGAAFDRERDERSEQGGQRRHHDRASRRQRKPNYPFCSDILLASCHRHVVLPPAPALALPVYGTTIFSY
jgi:hypothetical protein